MYLDLTLETQQADAISPISESTMFEDVREEFVVGCFQLIFRPPITYNTFTNIVQ